jgi:hypothetical protein
MQTGQCGSSRSYLRPKHGSATKGGLARARLLQSLILVHCTLSSRNLQSLQTLAPYEAIAAGCTGQS